MIVSVMYQIGSGNRFDLDYYMKTHMPLVGSLWRSVGLKEAQVLQGSGRARWRSGGLSHHRAAGFRLAGTRSSAAADAHGAEVLGDIPNFTDVQPAIQFNDRCSDGRGAAWVMPRRGSVTAYRVTAYRALAY